MAEAYFFSFHPYLPWWPPLAVTSLTVGICLLLVWMLRMRRRKR